MTNKKLKKVTLTSILTAMLASSFTISNAESYKVFIDAGHGGKDNGSSHNGYLEDVLNLQIAQNATSAQEAAQLISRNNRSEVGGHMLGMFLIGLGAALSGASVIGMIAEKNKKKKV